MIKYIGSKRVLVPRIAAAFDLLPRDLRVLDLFSGTARVGHALKGLGFEVHANDHNTYAWHLAGCYVGADRERLLPRVEAALAELDAAPPIDGWFTRTYARDSRYLQPDNAARIEGMRTRLDALAPPAPLDPDAQALRHVLLTALMEAADRVDSTVGVQMAWLKSWSRRSANPVTLRTPALLPGPGRATCLEAADAADAFDGDAAYLDPPYNQHSYLGNYHLWETLCRWDQPQVYGKARKRIDVRQRKSAFNSRPRIQDALSDVLARLRTPWIVLSFSDEGFLDRAALEALLAPRGHVAVVEAEHARYVGAKIGIHDDKGVRVGTVGHLKNRERLYIVGPDAARVRALAAAASRPGTR